MLYEFALTPQIFDDERNAGDPEWKENLRELGRSMFPRNIASPVVISDLYDGSWRYEFQTIIETIKDEPTKDLARSFVSMILDAVVTRPAIGDWPDDEDAWARQALATHGEEPLKRIVVSDQSYPTVQASGTLAVRLSQISGSACWKDVAPGQFVPMTIQAQVAAMRAMLVHSDFIAFISPHVRGERGDETDFMVSLIRSLAQRKWARKAMVVDLHVEAPDRAGASDFANRWQYVIDNLTDTFRPVFSLVDRIRVFAWPKLLNRYIFAGGVTLENDAVVPSGVRWGVSTPHIARSGDRAEVDEPFWQLLPTNKITPLYSKHYDLAPLCGPIDIVPRADA